MRVIHVIIPDDVSFDEIKDLRYVKDYTEYGFTDDIIDQILRYLEN